MSDAADTRDLAQARRAKDDLAERYAARPWYRGSGVERGPEGWRLRLNVDRRSQPVPDDLPQELGGFPIHVVFLGEYRPR
jgi:hypothetical protein